MKRALWFLMFPVMALIVNPLNDLTGAIREWWENF
jgi:hypothetical protein